MAPRVWKLIAGVLGGSIGVVAGYPLATFLYVGLRTVTDPTFQPLHADEVLYVALAGALFGGALGALVGVLAARVATDA